MRMRVLLRAMCDLVRVFVLSTRLYHDVYQLLLGVDVVFHAFPRQLAQRQEGKWPQEFQSLAGGFHVGVHLSPGYFNQLPLRIDERLRGLARQLGQLGLLGFPDAIRSEERRVGKERRSRWSP